MIQVRVHPEAIPEELRAPPRWVNWRYCKRKRKVTKVPLDPQTGELASCDDPGTWGTLEQALGRLDHGKVDGIGFQLGTPYVGLDLDKCRVPETGAIEPWAQQIIGAINSYTEISPSSRGVHIWMTGTLPAGGRRKGRVEMYDANRYLTFTGQHLEETPLGLHQRTAELSELHARVFTNPRGGRATNAGRMEALPQSDRELLQRAHQARNGAKFGRLWKGEWGEYESQSEADSALCMMLAFWTGRNPARIDALFRQSRLFRDKWDERHDAGGRTYGQITIERSVNQTLSTFGSGGHGDDVSRDARRTERCLPIIVVSDRQLRDVTDDALNALKGANDPPALFVRAGHLVRIRFDETGRAAIEVVTEAQLRGRLAEISNTVRLGRVAGARDCFPPLPVVENILALGQWPFPPLQSVVEVPVLRSDGSVLSKPGYDAATHLFYSPPSGLEIPEVPNAPSLCDLADALRLIGDAIGEFPFVDDAGQANAVGTALSPILRPAIKGPTPLCLIDAPQAGTGKGLLCEVIALINTGRAAAMMAAPREEDEWRKHLTAVLSNGASLITIDNVERRLESASLAIALTAREWSGRILGLSKIITVPIRVTWLASGNNISLGGDIPRRCYRIRLDAKVSRPWSRTGFKHPELLTWVAEHRGELIGALLTLAAAWCAAGRPEAPIPVVGSFEEWARTVGGVLHHAGVTGFLGNLAEMYESSDESSSQWEVFLQALAAAFDERCFTVKQVTERFTGAPELAETVPDELAEALEKAGSFQKRLGRAFSKRAGTRYGDAGVHLERAGEEKHAIKWRVRLG